jgi:HK97 family phage prohead protease
MEHLLLKAATTATDEGTFTAVISTATVDRDKDIIDPAGMVASLGKWVGVGKQVPLAYNHTDEVVGHIDPSTARIKNKEVVADGWVDQNAPRGPEVWRLVKSGTLSFSFGFLFDPMTGASKLPDGGYHIKELDVFEISVIPVGPANNDTRVLGWKSAEERDAVLTELQEVKGRLEKVEKALEDQESRKAEVTDQEPQARSVDPLRKQADALALEVASGGVSPQPPIRQVKARARAGSHRSERAQAREPRRDVAGTQRRSQ